MSAPRVLSLVDAATADALGLATRLPDAPEDREPTAARWTVSTAAANAPARALYERRGFALAEERDVDGAGIARYDRPLAL